ncbi:uroporphyrinogen-III synthase [Kaarinaea lacus]
MAKTLDGLTVLVTRPVHQAEKLCSLIESQGGNVLRFPVIEITEPRDTARLSNVLQRLNQFDIAVFISRNAAERGIQVIMETGGLPEGMKVSAVGKGTASQLNKMGVSVDIFPTEQFNSEALLAMHEMHAVSSKRVIIFRGEGGRELLADTLKSRGADVEYAECYRRIAPPIVTNELVDALSQGTLDIMTVTSNEGLHNLYDMVGEPGRTDLLKLPMVVVSERTRELAQKLGFTVPAIVADNASDEKMVQAIVDWQASRVERN